MDLHTYHQYRVQYGPPGQEALLGPSHDTLEQALLHVLAHAHESGTRFHPDLPWVAEEIDFLDTWTRDSVPDRPNHSETEPKARYTVQRVPRTWHPVRHPNDLWSIQDHAEGGATLLANGLQREAAQILAGASDWSLAAWALTQGCQAHAVPNSSPQAWMWKIPDQEVQHLHGPYPAHLPPPLNDTVRRMLVTYRARRVETPTVSRVFEKLGIPVSFHPLLHREIRTAARWWAKQLRTSLRTAAQKEKLTAPPSLEGVDPERFEKHLIEAMEEALRGPLTHYALPHVPEVLVSMDYTPDPILTTAATRAGIDPADLHMLLPWQYTTQFPQGQVLPWQYTTRVSQGQVLLNSMDGSQALPLLPREDP